MRYVRWTYALEQGVCRDSLAAETLRHFGWPAKALERFYDLLKADVAEKGQVWIPRALKSIMA